MRNKQLSMQALLEKATRVEELLSQLLVQQSHLSDGQAYLTIREAADLLCKSIHTLYGMVSRREIPHIKRGNRLYFSKTELYSWVQEGKRATILSN